MKLLPAFPPGRIPLYSNYHPGFVEKIKVIPGCSWNRAGRFWWVPLEMSNDILALGAHYRVQPSVRMPDPNTKPFGASTTQYGPKLPQGLKLHDFQMAGVKRALGSGHFIFSWETGLGKTPGAIVAASQNAQWPCLVITPAIVREHWARQIVKWSEHGNSVFIADSGKQWAKYNGEKFVITSFELANYSKMPLTPKAFIIDELHFLKNVKAKRSVAIADMLKQNQAVLQLGLTATPMSNDPIDVWHPLNCLWPGRFGNQYEFRKRYSRAEADQYAFGGYKYEGLNTQFADELKKRMAHVADRVTKQSVLHLLPPFIVEGLHFKPRDKKILEAARKAFGARGSKKKIELDASITIAFQEKAAIVFDLLESEAHNTSHLAVFTHLRSSAKALAKACRLKFPEHEVYHIDGSVNPKERDALIETAIRQPRAILCATMHSVGTGIDNLTMFQCAILAELVYSPLVLIQLLGRLSRLSGGLPAKCLLPIFDGTHDEVIGSSILGKIENTNAIFGASMSEVGLTNAIEDVETEDAFLDRLSTMSFEE